MKNKTIGLLLAALGVVSMCSTGVLAETTMPGAEIVQGSAEEMSVADVVQSSMPAMVSITSTSVQNVMDYFGGTFFFNDFFFNPGIGGEVESVSKGSGVIVGKTDDAILIATNSHVVDGAKELSVAFIDETAVEAEVIGTDDENDLALVRVSLSDLDDDTLDSIEVIPLGKSEDIVVGEEVVAIGNALGYGQSASRGIISALDRTVSDMTGTYTGLIQTDAAINPGNSGGALLNMKGELIGINCAKYASTAVEGMGYAIPIDDAEPILSDIANDKEDETESEKDNETDNDKDNETDRNTVNNENGTAHLGVTCVTISDDYAAFYQIPTGAYISFVDKGSAAEKAGIQEGDIITKVGDTAIGSSIDLKNVVSTYSAGDEVEMELTRVKDSNHFTGKASETLTVTVEFGVDESRVDM